MLFVGSTPGDAGICGLEGPVRLEWSAAALADLDRFAAFLHDRHPQLAKSIANQIRQRTSLLEEHPLIGRAIEGRPHFRELVLEVANATASDW